LSVRKGAHYFLKNIAPVWQVIIDSLRVKKELACDWL